MFMQTGGCFCRLVQILHVGVGFCTLNQFGAGWFRVVQVGTASCSLVWLAAGLR